ncbi:MAG: tail fiber domain-containing protein [Oligoflexia bacterium]|nr:tail fiber domain-containing protein [Oligoflexia bacterium]
MRSTHFFRENAGFTLTEVLITGGLLTIIMLGMTSFMTFTNRAVTSSRVSTDFTTLVTTLQGVLNNSTNCTTALGIYTLTPPSPPGPLSPPQSVPAIRSNGATGSVIAEVGPQGGTLEITRLEFTSANSLGAPNQYLADLYLEAKKIVGGGGAVGADRLSHHFLIAVTINPLAGNQIIGCSGMSDTLWQKAANASDIYYNGGRVGIGTNDPNTKLVLSENVPTGAPNGLNVNVYTDGGSLNSGGAHMRLFTARGTAAAATAVQAGDRLGHFNASGMWGGKASPRFEDGDWRAGIGIIAAENWIDNSHNGSDLAFYTTQNATLPGQFGGTGGPNERMRITQNGNVGIGTGTPRSKLTVSNEAGWSVALAQAFSSAASYHSAGFIGFRGRGTEAAPAYPAAGDSLAEFSGRDAIDGFDPTNFGGGSIVMTATEAFSASTKGSQIVFNTTSNGSNTQSNRMVINQNGNVGIGTATPALLLDVNGMGPSAQIRARRDGKSMWFDPNDNGANTFSQLASEVGMGLRFSVNYDSASNTVTDVMNIIPSGNVGIGTNSPLAALHINQNGQPQIMVTSSGGNSSFINLIGGATGNSGIVFGGTSLQNRASIGVSGTTLELGTAGTTKATIADNGNFGIGLGIFTASQKLQVGNSGDGSVAVANAWNTFSDLRLKADLERIPDACELVDQLNGYYFRWKDGSDRSRQIGVIAQEVQKVLPELVKNGTDGIKTVDYPKLTAVLIEAAKEHNRQLAALKEENAVLKAYLCAKDASAPFCR